MSLWSKLPQERVEVELAIRPREHEFMSLVQPRTRIPPWNKGRLVR